MPKELHRLAANLSDEEFKKLYGPLARLRPSEAAALFEGFGAPWWIVGGWAIEAFTGRTRDHEDLDVCVLARDLPELIEHFIRSHHVWATGGGVMCPILAAEQTLPRWLNQIWIRETATDPWLLDIIVSPDRDGRWMFKRDPTYIDELAAVTWRADDGILYQNPEITLAFKAGKPRPKDAADLDDALPHLSQHATAWLTETIARLYPGHYWLDRL
jgi:hypothetical protein